MPLLILVATSDFLVTASAADAASPEEYVRTYTVAHRADVRVHADESSVQIISSDTNQVEFRVRSEGLRFALGSGGDVRVDSQQNDDRVDLTVKMTRGAMIGVNTRHVSIEIHMPKNADLFIDTHDGPVELSSVNGNITVHTHDGAIKAEQLSGHIDLDTKDGGIDARMLRGEARLHTSDGGIAGEDLDGKFDVSSNDGTIRVAGRFDALDVKGSAGSVKASIARGSKMSTTWSIQTRDGGVDVSVPTDFQATVDASTLDGHITTGLPVAVQGDVSKSRLQGTLNGGGPVLLLRTDEGAIRLKGT